MGSVCGATNTTACSITVTPTAANKKVLISIVGQMAGANNTTTCSISFDGGGNVAKDGNSVNLEGSSGLTNGPVVGQVGGTFLVSTSTGGSALTFNLDVKTSNASNSCSFNNVSMVGIAY
jgi:hypothetical protein